jgi:hypothetical protein
MLLEIKARPGHEACNLLFPQEAPQLSGDLRELDQERVVPVR